MTDITVTAVGNVASDVRRIDTASGLPMARFRIASSGRRFDRQRGEWADLPATFIAVVCWRALADNALRCLSKGDPVVVTGRLRARTIEREGRTENVYEIEAISVGHDLARGTSTFQRHRRAEPSPVVTDGPPPDLAHAS
jgi:single-strand DNA-binding protein